uniref:NADH dehydrogenase [ubiquinone] 1 subunit C2 n=1 Tax=Corethrella appendiculata TaxID=1370023 RepID=U5EFI4_9DIPT
MTQGPSALELLSGYREPSFIYKHWAPVSCGLFGFLGVCFVNWGTRRPPFSGIQKHIIATLVVGYTGKTVDGWRNEYLAERDAVLRHYVELHPEDFPAPIRKKWGEIFDDWAPIR